MKSVMMGIYFIENVTNGHMYIGSAKNIDKRWWEHSWGLKNKRHHNAHLQSAWDKYGEENFDFGVIELVERLEDLTEREQFWLDETRVYERGRGYNLSPSSRSCRGIKHPPEFGQKIRETKLGKKRKPFTEEAKKNMSLCKMGTMLSPETRRKMSETKRQRSGRTPDEVKKQKRDRLIAIARVNGVRPREKLDWDRVDMIRKRLSEGESAIALSLEFGVTRTTIYQIKTNSRWKIGGEVTTRDNYRSCYHANGTPRKEADRLELIQITDKEETPNEEE